MTSVAEPVNRMLTSIARPRLTIGGRSWCAFHVMGALGFVLTASLCLWLTWSLNRNLAVGAAVIATAVACLWLLAHLRKIVTGEEGLTYYHHEVAVLGANAAVLAAIGQPVLPYLDIAALSLGLFLACGRVGCFLVGCCHGRPSRWGVRYGTQTVQAGFPPHLKDVCLRPVQLVEAAWVLATVAGGIAVIRGAPPGAALAWYSIVYGWGRFLFEFERGDSVRPYRMGFSEAQWTSLLLMTSTAGLEFAGVLPFQAWHIAATLALAATMAALRAAADPSRWLSHPRHVEQLAALVAAPRLTRQPHVGDTSLGIRVSASAFESDGERMELFAFSAVEGALGPRRAGRLATLAAQLKGFEKGAAWFQGNGGVYHLILPPRAILPPQAILPSKARRHAV